MKSLLSVVLLLLLLLTSGCAATVGPQEESAGTKVDESGEEYFVLEKLKCHCGGSFSIDDFYKP